MANQNNYTYAIGATSPTYLQQYRRIYTERQYGNPVIYTNNSRYTNVRTLTDEDTGNVYHENWIQKFIDRDSNDSYMTVSIREKDRLDIISNDYYGTPNYWWVIALGNYIIDPFNVPVGTYLRIPQIISLYNEGGILSNG